MSAISRSNHAALVASFFVFIVFPASAQTWRAVSMTVDDKRLANSISTFADGIGHANNVLSDRPDGLPTGIDDVRITVGFLDMSEFVPESRPVRINEDEGTVNLSSIYATGWRAEFDCIVHSATCDREKPHLVWVAAVGWDFGPVQALPFVKTIDGSMMATWNAVASRVSHFDGFGNRRIQFTFAQSLPSTPDGFVETHKTVPGAGLVSDIAGP